MVQAEGPGRAQVRVCVQHPPPRACRGGRPVQVPTERPCSYSQGNRLPVSISEQTQPLTGSLEPASLPAAAAQSGAPARRGLGGHPGGSATGWGHQSGQGPKELMPWPRQLLPALAARRTPCPPGPQNPCLGAPLQASVGLGTTPGLPAPFGRPRALEAPLSWDKTNMCSPWRPLQGTPGPGHGASNRGAPSDLPQPPPTCQHSPSRGPPSLLAQAWAQPVTPVASQAAGPTPTHLHSPQGHTAPGHTRGR